MKTLCEIAIDLLEGKAVDAEETRIFARFATHQLATAMEQLKTDDRKQSRRLYGLFEQVVNLPADVFEQTSSDVEAMAREGWVATRLPAFGGAMFAQGSTAKH